VQTAALVGSDRRGRNAGEGARHASRA
jgi:hypothetical protein